MSESIYNNRALCLVRDTLTHERSDLVLRPIPVSHIAESPNVTIFNGFEKSAAAPPVRGFLSVGGPAVFGLKGPNGLKYGCPSCILIHALPKGTVFSDAEQASSE